MTSFPTRPVAFLMHFVRRYRLRFSAILALHSIAAVFSIARSYALKDVVDGVNEASITGGDIGMALLMGLILFTAVKAGYEIFQIAAHYVRMYTMPWMRTDIRAAMFNYLMNHSYHYFQEEFAGKLGARIAEASLASARVVRLMIRNALPTILALVFSYVLLSMVHPVFFAVYAGWTIVYLLVSGYYARKGIVLELQSADARSTATGKIVDAVTNVMNVRMFARLTHEEHLLEKQRKEEIEKVYRSWGYFNRLRAFQGLSNIVLMAATVGFVVLTWQWGVISLGDVAMVLTLSVMVMTRVEDISDQMVEFFQEWGAMCEGLQIIAMPHEIKDNPEAPKLRVPEGRVTFQDVSFRYPNSETDVFSNMNVTISPGEKVGLVGFSGSGKSTFVSLMLRFFEVQQGQILVDGQDITQVTQKSLHQQISMIPQDPSLFHRTLMENIRYGREDATDEEVVEAARLADAHSFIQGLAQGYHTIVGERGIKLSGGQRQRIAIARAILKDAPILVLDEATSALDSVTEKSIQKSLDNLMDDKTVVVIAHRLSTIAHMDRILVFDEGEIVEEGNHKELVENGGHYAKLWAMQAGGFLPEEAAA